MEGAPRQLRPVADLAGGESASAASAEPSAGGWEVLASGDTAQLGRAWLESLGAVLPGCEAAVLYLGAPDTGPFLPVGSWPGSESVAALRPVAVQALASRSECQDLEARALALPLLFGDALHGAVAVQQPGLADPECVRRTRATVGLGLGWLGGGRRGTGIGAGLDVEAILSLLATTLEQGRFQGAVTAFATELSNALGCERVSVGLLRRGRIRIRGLSHSAEFGERANLLRCAAAAMEEALDQRCVVAWPAAPEALPRGAHAHAELSRQFGAQAICTVPILRGGEPRGAVLLEREAPFDAETRRSIEVAAALAGATLDAQYREERFIGAKVLDAMGDGLAAWLGPGRLALKLGSIAALGVFAFLALGNGTFRVTADAVLEPSVQRAAVAPFDGYVAESAVRAGDLVVEGDLLAALDDRDLALERVRWESSRAQAAKQYRQALARREAAEAEVYAAAVREAQAEQRRIEELLARTELRAPFDGVVVSGDLSQRLRAPVRRGEVLYEIAPLDRYRIHIEVDEADVGWVEVGQPGTLVLSALPHERFPFEVNKLTPVSEAEGGRNTFRVEAELFDEASRLRPGEQGVAKIEVGERRLLWIWTRGATNWLRLKLWTLLP